MLTGTHPNKDPIKTIVQPLNLEKDVNFENNEIKNLDCQKRKLLLTLLEKDEDKRISIDEIMDLRDLIDSKNHPFTHNRNTSLNSSYQKNLQTKKNEGSLDTNLESEGLSIEEQEYIPSLRNLSVLRAVSEYGHERRLLFKRF